MSNYLSDIGPPQRVCEFCKPAKDVDIRERILEKLNKIHEDMGLKYCKICGVPYLNYTKNCPH